MKQCVVMWKDFQDMLKVKQQVWEGEWVPQPQAGCVYAHARTCMFWSKTQVLILQENQTKELCVEGAFCS